MDINLRGLSGLDALKILRGDPVTAHIPVVGLSANAMPHDIRKGLEAGFFRYLTKPINVNAFMDTVNEALEFCRARRQAPHDAVSGANEKGLQMESVTPCDRCRAVATPRQRVVLTVAG